MLGLSLFCPLFKVRLSEPELVKPESATPREKKPLAETDDQPDLRYQMPSVWFYEKKESMAGIDPAKVIKEGLAKALVFYYPLAGRLFEGPNKKLIVDCNGEGVMFIEADADIALEKLGDSIRSPTPHLSKFLYNDPGTQDITGTPIFLVQVTRFSCGGFALGVRFNHTMVDGFGFVQFIKAVNELAQGASSPSILPVWERELLTARSNPYYTCKHDVYDEPKMRINNCFDLEWLGNLFISAQKVASNPLHFFFPPLLRISMVQSSVIFGPKEIQALRNQAKESCTRFELIVACLWKCRTIALRPSSNATVRVTFPMDIRRKSLDGKDFPSGYYGNAIIHVSAATTAQLLCESSIFYAVQLIREAKNRLTSDYIKSVVDFMVINGKPRMSVLRNMFFSDLSRIGMDKIDFGWGEPIFAGLGSATYGMSFLECLKTGDTTESSVLVPLALPHMSMPTFKREFKKMTSPSL